MKLFGLNIEYSKKSKPAFEPTARNQYLSSFNSSVISEKYNVGIATRKASFEDYREIYFANTDVQKIVDKIGKGIADAVVYNPLDIDVALLYKCRAIFGFELLKGFKVVDLFKYKRQIGNSLVSNSESIQIENFTSLTPAPFLLENSYLYGLLEVINLYQNALAVSGNILRNPLPELFITEKLESDYFRNKVARQKQSEIEGYKDIATLEAGVRDANEMALTYNEWKNRVYMTPNEVKVTQLKPLNVNDLAIETVKKIYEETVCKPFDFPELLLNTDNSTYSNIESAVNEQMKQCLRTNQDLLGDYVKNGIIQFTNETGL